jgi:tetratricopeptide (TPR) repeat protein
MRSKVKVLALSLLVGIAGAAAPAIAQNTQPQATIKISPQASKAIAELQTAVKANDFANVPAKATAASAVARTPDDRYAVAQLQLQAALAQKNDPATMAALEAMLATGRVPPQNLSNLRINLAKLKYAAKDFAGASSALEALVAAEPNNAEALILLGETRNSQGRPAEGVAMMQKAIAARAAAGQPAPKEWTKRAVALAHNNKLPAAGPLALDWVRSDPSPTNWRDAIRIYAAGGTISDADQIDLYRLQRVAGALNGEADYFRYANGAASKGLPGEAKAVMDEGFASGAIKRSQPSFASLYPVVSGKIAADRASLPAGERSALTGSAARPALVTGDAYLGYGDYAKAAALYRAALGKSGADKDLLNLRLGIALARAGDKAGAMAALNSVSGARAPIARLWQAWLGSRT